MKVRYADLVRAAEPGAVRDLVVDLFSRARANPWRAGRVLVQGHRDLRRLRSRQRRWTLDALYDLVRHERMLALLTGSDAPEALWLGWLVRNGLDPDEAATAGRVDLDLSRCARWESEVAQALATRSAVHATALLGSLEPVAARQLLDRYGKDGAWAFIDASNERAPIALRANRLRGTREELVRALRDQGVDCTVGVWAPDAVLVHQRVELRTGPLWASGAFEVQDEGSQLLAELVDPGGLVVDLCAGAGGKTLALAARHPDRLVACDVRERALHELHKRAARAGAAVEVHQLGADGALPRAVARLRADRVLVDAPCTGSGVLRRHPERRWLIDGPHLERCVALQHSILHRAAGLVRPGGRLIYGTCSVFPAENREVVRAFLDRHPDFAPLPARRILGDGFGEVLEVAPHTHGTDGFFGAVLVRA